MHKFHVTKSMRQRGIAVFGKTESVGLAPGDGKYGYHVTIYPRSFHPSTQQSPAQAGAFLVMWGNSIETILMCAAAKVVGWLV